MTKFTAVIPARYASTRFPGKPLIDIAGKTMIQRVYEQVLKAGIDAVYVATDHQAIAEHVNHFGGRFLMTSETHQSGTDRCNECASLLKLDDNDVMINIQGDEPFIKPSQISLLCGLFEETATEIGTLIKKVATTNELQQPTIPKVVLNKHGEAIFFSRSVIPYPAKKSVEELLASGIYYKHIGIYAYRINILKQIAALPPSLLEQTESLEQLRWIENGYAIKSALTNEETIAIDTPDDLTKALHFLHQNS
jgi:3-deoxy-manno-octulosonate cytidylyltransferase (CMP-KDO synthetase)